MRDVGRGLALFVALFVGAQALAVAIGAHFGLESDQFYAAVFLSSALAELGYAGIAYHAVRRSPDGAWRALGIRRPSLSTLAWAAGGLVAAIAVAVGYSLAVEALDIDALRTSCDEQIPAAVRENAWLLALAAFVAIVFAPPCEELFFRGFVFQGIGARWGIGLGIVASALIFAAPHLTYRSLVPIFAAGAIFAATYWRSGNLLSAIAAHTAFNSISIAAIASGGCD